MSQAFSRVQLELQQITRWTRTSQCILATWDANENNVSEMQNQESAASHAKLSWPQRNNASNLRKKRTITKHAVKRRPARTIKFAETNENESKSLDLANANIEHFEQQISKKSPKFP